MTTIKNLEILHLLIAKMKKETASNKHIMTGHNAYLPLIIDNWDMIDETQKKEIVQYCLAMSMAIKGSNTKNFELGCINNVLNLPNFHKIKPYLEEAIEQLPTKNGNQVIQRYIQALVWKTNLTNTHFDKINDKTNIAVRGWLLTEMLSTLPHENAARQWMCKRLYVSYNKNSVEENIMAIQHVDLNSLNDTDIRRFFTTVNHLFTSCETSLTVDDVLSINTKVGMYLDTIADIEKISLYNGIPPTMLASLPVTDTYVQRYAMVNIFNNWEESHYYFGDLKILHVDSTLFKECRLFKERTPEMEESFKANILNSIYYRGSSPLDAFFFDYFSMGFKVLLTMVMLLKMMHQPLNNKNINIIPQLNKISEYLNIDITPVLTSMINDQPIHDVVNLVFKDFFQKSTEKMNVFANIFNVELSLIYYDHAFNFQHGVFEKKDTAKRTTIREYSALLDIFDKVLKDMGADLGYTKEEIELLF